MISDIIVFSIAGVVLVGIDVANINFTKMALQFTWNAILFLIKPVTINPIKKMLSGFSSWLKTFGFGSILAYVLLWLGDTNMDAVKGVLIFSKDGLSLLVFGLTCVILSYISDVVEDKI
jgi:hypothetical protein